MRIFVRLSGSAPVEWLPNLRLGVVVLFFLLLFGGCAPPTPSVGGPPEPLTQTVDGLTFSVTLSPKQLQSRESTSVEVRLVDSQAQPVEGGRMVVSLESNGHAMAPNVATAEAKGGGLYHATLRPAGMTGEHAITVEVEWKGRSYRATFGGVNVR